MAQTTTDLAAEKARKQKIILAVAGVLLAGLAAIQLPKLMSSDSGAAPAAEASDSVAVDTASPTPGIVPAAPVGSTVQGKPAGYISGVALPSAARPKAATSQLTSFTLFESKDPFLQQVDDEAAAAGSPNEEAGVGVSGGAPAAGGGKAGAEAPGSTGGAPGVAPGASPSDGGTTGGASGPGSAPASEPLAFATMMVNGNPEQLESEKTFPEDDDVFVLVGVKKKAVQIGVAGGSFEGGKPVTLKLGKKMTLVNSATGARYVLKLVYTGSEPETLETFSTGADDGSGDASATP